MKKRYEVKGMMEWHPMFAAGRARIQVSFTGGHLGDGCSTPAVYETSDAVVQKVIENSSAFRSGRIRIGACTPDSTDVAQKIYVPASEMQPPSQPSPEPKSKALDEFAFESYDDAVDFLHYQKGVSEKLLLNIEDCKRQAELLGFKIIIKS